MEKLKRKILSHDDSGIYEDLIYGEYSDTEIINSNLPNSLKLNKFEYNLCGPMESIPRINQKEMDLDKKESFINYLNYEIAKEMNRKNVDNTENDVNYQYSYNEDKN